MRLSKYLLFQAFGWVSYALFNIYVAYINEDLSYTTFYVNLLIILFGFLSTHIYRNYIVRHAWMQLDTEKLIRYVLLATAVLTVLYNIIYHSILYIMHLGVKDPREFVVTMITVYVLFAIWNLFYFTWQYLEKNRRILIDTLKMESSLKDLEIKTIRSNLQPHFIFNSLNSIRALIDEDPELARDAITRISNILRNTITKQDATDTLDNELALAEDYLALEKIRFEERLHFTKKIAEETLDVQIPTMMLQTLIENAIKHGISNLEAGGEISLDTSIANGMLQIKVINDINPAQIRNEENSLGFGLSSSRQRLKLLYGEKASLLLSFEKARAVLTVCLPVHPG